MTLIIKRIPCQHKDTFAAFQISYMHPDFLEDSVDSMQVPPKLKWRDSNPVLGELNIRMYPSYGHVYNSHGCLDICNSREEVYEGYFNVHTARLWAELLVKVLKLNQYYSNNTLTVDDIWEDAR